MISTNKQSYLIVKIVLFFIGFLYFSNSIGLINSADTPQFFTTESIINYHTIDLTNFKNHPHFFVYPDVYKETDKIFSIRGFLFSILTLPIHVLARPASLLISYKFLPSEIIYPNFALELSITMLFSLVSLSCLAVLSICLYFAKINSKIAAATILATGLGTYFWKYAGSIGRQPLIALFIIIWQTMVMLDPKAKNNRFGIIISILAGITFGIDPILFISLGFFILLDCVILARNNPKQAILRAVIYIFSAIYISVFHFIFYGRPSYSLYDKYDSFQEIPREKLSSFLFGTPLQPTINYVFFGKSPLSEKTLINFNNYPTTKEAFSANYASKYDFYGLFFITPIFLLSLLGLFQILKNNLRLFLYTAIVFGVNILLTLKWFGFYGGNSYDVRYFYPFMILLALPTAIAIKYILAIKNMILKILSIILISALSLWSVFMGWLGVINMYKPALTGERRIFVSLTEFIANPKAFTFSDYFNATLPNFYNAISFTLLFIAAYSIYKLISNKSFISGRK